MASLSVSVDPIWAALLERLCRDPRFQLFANDRAAILLRAPNEAAINPGNSAGAAMIDAGISAATMARLDMLAGGLAPISGVRLERLELPGADGQSVLTAACRRIRDEDGRTLLVVAVQDAAALPTAPTEQASPAEPSTPVEPNNVADLPVAASPDRAPEPLPEKVRFLWAITADGLITSVSREALDVFGHDLGNAMIGQHWSSLCGSLVHDPSGSVMAAFEAGKTWSGHSTLWRIPGHDQAYPVTLAGLPVTDAGRQLTGWRGFGVIDTRRTEPFPVPEPVAATADQQQPELDVSVDGEPATTASGDPSPAADVTPDVEASPASDVTSQAPNEKEAASENDAAPEVDEAVVPVSNIVPIRPDELTPQLSRTERNAFREIAKALGARIEGHDPEPARDEPAMRLDSAGAAASPAGTEASADQPAATPVMVDRVLQLVPPAPARDDMFVSLLDKLPIGVLVLRGGAISYANRTLLDLLDVADLNDLVDYGVDQLFRGAAPSEGGGVFSLTRPDGDVEPVDARLSAIMWHGQPATLMSFRRALDQGNAARIEALKLDVARATEKARELTAILDTATDGVATFDERGRILSLNRSAEALFGYDQREVTGENFTLLLAPESHITALDYLEGLKGGGVASLLNDGREVQGRVRQGGRIPLFMTMGRVADGPEKIYSAVLRDMTAWKRAEADLLEARRHAELASAQKSDVLAKISHEIRTPLNAILGFAEVMSEERFGPIGNDRYKEYLGDIHQSGGYLISLINDLLDLAKIEAGKMDLTFTGVSLNEIASAAVSLLQPEANRQRVVLRTGLQPKLPAVVADDRSLRQIVINLLSNAVKFTDAGGQVIISTALGDRGEVILRVRDTGVGMTEKELALAMEPFRQVSSTRRGTGTGLGLPITKALVEANKGQLLLTSAKNEGTLAEITFPPQRVLAS